MSKGSWNRDDKTYTPPPTGAHYAICVGIFGIGSQTRTLPNGKTEVRDKTVIMFELPYTSNPDNENKPFCISNFYTTSLYEKSNLRKDLTSWYGRALTEEECKEFDPTTLLGCWAHLILIANPKNGKTMINTILAPGDLSQYDLPAPTYSPIYFSVHEFDQAAYDKIPAGIRRMVDESAEMQANPPSPPVSARPTSPQPAAQTIPVAPAPRPAPRVPAPNRAMPPVPTPGKPSKMVPKVPVVAEEERPVEDDIPF